MRILVVSNFYPPDFQGGYELGCSHMVQALRAAGHDVRVVTSAASARAGGDLADVSRALRMPPIRDGARMAALTPAAWRDASGRADGLDEENVRLLAEEVESFAPDAGYLWNLLGIGGLGVLGLLERLGVPWVWHLMDAVPRLLCSDGDRVLPEPAAAFGRLAHGRYLACSLHVLGEIRAAGIELGDKIELLPNWVSGPLPAAREEFYAGGVLRVASAAALLGERKGTDILIEAAALLHARGERRVRLTIYGHDADHRFAALIARRGLGDLVELPGLLAQDELLPALADHDVFAFPTAWREPFAFAPLEAAAVGCVPLISGDCGNAEWMVGGVHCLKAQRTPEAFAAAIGAVLDGEFDLAALGRRAQAIVRDQFHLPALVDRVERALRGAITDVRAPGGAERAAGLEELARALAVAPA